MKLIYEESVAKRRGVIPPSCTVDSEISIPQNCLRAEKAPLPEVSELDVIRHYTNLSRLNYSVDTNFYPLGSCTMKYNPKVNELVARLEGFTSLHPYLSLVPGGTDKVQGALEALYETEQKLCEITGMKAVTLQPFAGANGEFTGVMLIAAYHKDRGDVKRKRMLIPDSAHGTNPASAMMAGFEITSIPSDEKVMEVWKTLPTVYAKKMRLAETLAHAKTAISESDGLKYLTFFVMNVPQKQWIEDKILREIEGKVIQGVGSTKVRVLVDVTPDEQVEAKPYTAKEKAEALMQQNAEVKNIIQDLNLDV